MIRPTLVSPEGIMLGFVLVAALVMVISLRAVATSVKITTSSVPSLVIMPLDSERFPVIVVAGVITRVDPLSRDRVITSVLPVIISDSPAAPGMKVKALDA